jgi:hypothetical protein
MSTFGPCTIIQSFEVRMLRAEKQQAEPELETKGSGSKFQREKISKKK